MFPCMREYLIFRGICRRYYQNTLASAAIYRLNPVRSKSSKVEEVPKVDDKPVPFLSSDAAKWKAIYSTAGDRVLIRPRYENLVIAFSLTIFMIYFCILREENDLDDWVSSLQADVPIEVQELKLRSAVADGIRQGQDTKELQKQLAEVMRIRKEMLASASKPS